MTLNVSPTVTVSANTLTVGGAITNSLYSLTKNGSGTLALTNGSGSSTFTGLNLNAGTLAIFYGSSLGAIGSQANPCLTFTGNSTLTFLNSSPGFSASRYFTINSGVVATIDVPSTWNIPMTNIIQGSGALTITDTGSLTLYGVNTYSGATTINSGSLLTMGGSGSLGSGSYSAVVTNNGVFNYNSSAAQTLSGIISGIGTLTQSSSRHTDALRCKHLQRWDNIKLWKYIKHQ